MIRRSVAEIDLSAIAHNLQSIQKIVKKRSVIAVVKASAYGHGAVTVSKKLLTEGVPYLAVACLGEAIELRDSGITAPIIVLFDGQAVREHLDFNLTPVIYSVNTASSLSLEARRRNSVIKIHVKIDTGMGRMGLWGDHVVEDILRIAEMPGLEIAGLLSHFSEADLLDRSYAISQLGKFKAVQRAISHKLGRKIFSHMANSAAVLSFEDAYLDAVRPGIMLYGYSPFSDGRAQGAERKDIDLIPAMKVKSHILCIRNLSAGTPISYGRTFITKRQSRIGAIAMGYADGYFRVFSNNAEVLVRGKRAPVVGRVCMDLTMVDLTDLREAEENDEVIMLGDQGNESITADELASKANTISYEILTSLGSRARRVYVDANDALEERQTC